MPQPVEELVDRVLAAHSAHDALGVSRGASNREYDKAYRKLMLKLHPDKCKHPRAEEASKHLNSLRDKHVSMTRRAEARSANTSPPAERRREPSRPAEPSPGRARPQSPPPPPRGDPNAYDDEDEDIDNNNLYHYYQ